VRESDGFLLSASSHPQTKGKKKRIINVLHAMTRQLMMMMTPPTAEALGDKGASQCVKTTDPGIDVSTSRPSALAPRPKLQISARWSC
jgi:hypothetical protein